MREGFGKRIGWFGLAVLGLLTSLILQMALGLLGGIAAVMAEMFSHGVSGIYDPEMLGQLENTVMGGAIWGVVGYHLTALPVFGLWYYFGCGRKKPVNPAGIFTVRRLLAVIAAGFGLCILANGMVLTEEFLLPRAYAQYEQLVETVGFGENIFIIFASITLAPIGEELLCRGIIFHYCQKASAGIGSRETSFWIANVLQALFFAIMHGNLVQGSYAFVLGLGLGVLRYRYDSLYPSMLVHFLINFLSTYVMEYLLAWVPESLPGGAVLLIMGVAVTAISIWIGKREETA